MYRHELEYFSYGTCQELWRCRHAGSERQKASGAANERLREASSINKSLSTLGHVIMSLADVQRGAQRHVPYRDSRLTYLLQACHALPRGAANAAQHAAFPD